MSITAAEDSIPTDYQPLGLDRESVRILAEMRGEVPTADGHCEPSENMVVDADHTADIDQWEDIADEHDGDTAFVHALRDVVGSQ